MRPMEQIRSLTHLYVPCNFQSLKVSDPIPSQLQPPTVFALYGPPSRSPITSQPHLTSPNA
ncbi:hypothetical protein E2C01_076393 [Portunus trituberculatus]|uniref:Uncharacterized protein n=1 Tax=Portunus trituberculatus TaxID=210409 RepID=A0A5B7IBB8_PORTR|nr:hypothetical protein [Portunus trituberculatus]